MDACGVIVAASEVIRFETGSAIFFLVYNKHKDFYFYVFAYDNLSLWKKVFVNQYYKFLHLKVGAIEWLCGTQTIALKTTLESIFQDVTENELQMFTISHDLMKKLCVPAISLDPKINLFSTLISYQGIITKVKNSKLGLYELDNKVHLYCIFNSFRASLNSLHEGCEIFASNVHFFEDSENRKVLVCCGLSSVKSLKAEEISEEEVDALCNVLYQYSFSIYDIIWLETLLIKLSAKFCTFIASDDIFNWESKIIKIILVTFSKIPVEITWSERLSIGHEFCGKPHICCVFCNDILPTGCKVPFISEILDMATSKFSWIANSDTWKTKFVENESNDIVIGMLYLSKDGCFYLLDNSCRIPVILTRRCVDCNSSKNILCSFEDLNLAYLVALQNFEIVFEKIKCKKYEYTYCKFLKTSCCYLFHPATFYKQKDSMYLPYSKNDFNVCHISNKSIDPSEVAEMLEKIHLDKQDLWSHVDDISFVPFNTEDLVINNARQYMLTVSKIWTVTNQTFVCYQILVLLLPQEVICQEYFNISKSLFEDSDNYYETDDDTDFAELVNKMDSLFLEDKPRLARLHFESAKKCATLLPGHIYVIDFSENFSNDSNFSVLSEKNSIKPFLIKIKRGVKVIHYGNCLGNHYIEDYNVDLYCDIKQIVSERKVKENSVIRGIIFDKFYEESFNSCSSPSNVSEKMTLCLVLKDFSSKYTIRAYLRSCPKNIYGFLPGVTVLLYGFSCICSKRGFLYLTPTTGFGIQIVNLIEFQDPDNKTMMKSPDLHHEDLKLAHIRTIPISDYFKCICFIINVTTAKLSLTCNSCAKDFEDNCSCLCSYSTKLTVNFIIDDGSGLAVAISWDESARKILMLSEKEWKSLASYVTKTRVSLKFSLKAFEDGSCSSSPSTQAFSVYCSSKFHCRQVLLMCKKKSGTSKSSFPSVWCYDVLNICETDLIPELIIKVKNIGIQNV